MDLHNQIMNVRVDTKIKEDDYTDLDGCVDAGWISYKVGHRDARHAAAELSLKAEARIEELESVLSKFVNWTTDEAGTKSLIDDVELWELAEKVLESK